MSINDEQQQQQHQWCEVDGDSVINQLRIWKLIVEGIQPPRHVLKRVIEQSIRTTLRQEVWSVAIKSEIQN